MFVSTYKYTQRAQKTNIDVSTRSKTDIRSETGATKYCHFEILFIVRFLACYHSEASDALAVYF
jgi:hypothetical protein